MASIQALPPELVLSICESAEDFSTLKALCLTSRTIGSLAREVLYRHLVFRKPGQRLWPLVHMSMNQPHLAKKVRTLNYSLKHHQQPEKGPRQSAGSEHCDFVGEVTLYLSQLLPDSPRVIDHVLSSISSLINRCSMTALLLLLLPQLKELNLKAWHRAAAITSPGLVEAIYGPLLNIVSEPELRHVTNRLDEVGKLTTNLRLFRLLSFFDFGSLETLVLSLVEHDGNSRYMGDPAEFLTHTSSFPRLQRVSIFTTLQEFEDDPWSPWQDPHLLPYVISAICAPSQLKPTQNMFQCLELKVCGLHTSAGGPYSLKPIVSALQSLKDSLTKLTILLACGPTVRSRDLNIFCYVATIPNMGQFSRLRRLAVPPDFLIHRSIRKPPHRQFDFTRFLPTSLREMNLIYPGGVLIPWLKGLVQQVHEFPDLKFMYLRCIPQHGRSASWFRKHRNASRVFKVLKSHGISIGAVDIYEGPPPRNESTRRDILDVHDGALITDEVGGRTPLYEVG